MIFEMIILEYREGVLKIGAVPSDVLHPNLSGTICKQCEWEFQGPQMEVLYHIRPYFVGMLSYIGHRPYIGLIYEYI